MGGCVRDACLGRVFTDLDLACVDAKNLASALARRTKGALVTLDDKTRVYRVVLKSGLQADLAEIQGQDIEEDLARRDFTVNAVAVPLPLESSGGRAVDPFAGLRDIRERRLKPVSERVFVEDPLRLLRAFRLSAQLGFSQDPSLLAGVRKHRRLILKPAGERVRAELMALLGSPESAVWLKTMDETGLLTAVLEELEPERRCAEVYYGAGGVLRHTLDAVARMDFLWSNLEKVFGELAAPLRAHLLEHHHDLSKHGALLKLAVLLHDVAKPDCARQVQGRLRFFGHDHRGAEAVSRILRRLRCSRDEEHIAAALTLHHLRPGNLAAAGAVTDKAVFRFFRDLGPLGVSQLLLCWADHASYLQEADLRKVLRWASEDPHAFRPPKSLPEDTAKTLRHLQVIAYLLQRYFLQPDTARPVRLLDGQEVMDLLGIPPGPPVGEVLRKLEEAQSEGRVRDREEALRFVRRLRLTKN